MLVKLEEACYSGGSKRFWCPVCFFSTQRIKYKNLQIILCRGDTTSTAKMENPTKLKCGNNFRFSRSECSCGGHDRSNRRSQVYLPSVWKNVWNEAGWQEARGCPPWFRPPLCSLPEGLQDEECSQRTLYQIPSTPDWITLDHVLELTVNVLKLLNIEINGEQSFKPFFVGYLYR